MTTPAIIDATSRCKVSRWPITSMVLLITPLQEMQKFSTTETENKYEMGQDFINNKIYSSRAQSCPYHLAFGAWLGLCLAHWLHMSEKKTKTKTKQNKIN